MKEEQERLDNIRKQLEELEQQNKTDTLEYEELSDDYQSIAQNMILPELLGHEDQNEWIWN